VIKLASWARVCCNWAILFSGCSICNSGSGDNGDVNSGGESNIMAFSPGSESSLSVLVYDENLTNFRNWKVEEVGWVGSELEDWDDSGITIGGVSCLVYFCFLISNARWRLEIPILLESLSMWLVSRVRFLFVFGCVQKKSSLLAVSLFSLLASARNMFPIKINNSEFSSSDKFLLINSSIIWARNCSISVLNCWSGSRVEVVYWRIL